MTRVDLLSPEELGRIIDAPKRTLENWRAFCCYAQGEVPAAARARRMRWPRCGKTKARLLETAG